MTERINKLTQAVMEGRLYPEIKTTEYDREDLFLPDVTRSAKHLCVYMQNQEPVIHDDCHMTGHLRFDGSVEGDVFTRIGHKHFGELCNNFYNKPLHNLVTFEWQHSTANFDYVIKDGISGIMARIEDSRKRHSEKAETEFLDAMKMVCGGIIGWAHKCSKAAAEKAMLTKDIQRKKRFEELSATLMKVPEKPAESFYEAVLCVYFCFSFLPDSIGTIDRYLYPFYRKDIDGGKITQDEAKELLQELFLRLQAHTSRNSDRFTRGGESHFCIGGYTPQGEDGFNDLSRLIVEALMELPTYIPQISLRWTKKTPFEVFRFMLDCERKDKNKRIAFVSDEPRIKALMEIVGLSYEEAVNYTMVGCNELALQGGIWMGSAQENIARSLTNTLYYCSDETAACKDFEEFYQLYERELYKDMAEILVYEDKFNDARSKDTNIISSIFIKGCIENAKSVTQGGSDLAIAGIDIMGMTNVIDSLTMIQQFVYDEKRATMQQLLDALKNNWEGYDELHTMILKKGRFFGNHDSLSDDIARRFINSIYHYLKGKTNLFGYRYLVGNLIGYNQHHKWFGERTAATPDGRYNGDALSFGIGQSEGKDREGLTALLVSVAQADEHAVLCGPTVTNILLDEKLVTDEENFEKTAKMLETYFGLGGLHFQLTYVSKEDLKKAKVTPQQYKSLRVRVSGFSDYFVSLNEDLQDEIIKRTAIGFGEIICGHTVVADGGDKNATL